MQNNKKTIFRTNSLKAKTLLLQKNEHPDTQYQFSIAKVAKLMDVPRVYLSYVINNYGFGPHDTFKDNGMLISVQKFNEIQLQLAEVLGVDVEEIRE